MKPAICQAISALLNVIPTRFGTVHLLLEFGVAVARIGIAVALGVGGTVVAVGGTVVAVGGTVVAVGGTVVAVGGTAVAVAAPVVAVAAPVVAVAAPVVAVAAPVVAVAAPVVAVAAPPGVLVETGTTTVNVVAAVEGDGGTAVAGGDVGTTGGIEVGPVGPEVGFVRPLLIPTKTSEVCVPTPLKIPTTTITTSPIKRPYSTRDCPCGLRRSSRQRDRTFSLSSMHIFLPPG